MTLQSCNLSRFVHTSRSSALRYGLKWRCSSAFAVIELISPLSYEWMSTWQYAELSNYFDRSESKYVPYSGSLFISDSVAEQTKP